MGLDAISLLRRNANPARLKASAGAVGLTFAIVASMLVTAAGVAIEYARAVNARSKIQQALDAAVLAAAKETTTNAGREARARVVFAANLVDIGFVSQPQLTFTFPTGRVSVIARATLDTPLLSLAGIGAVDVGTQATAEVMRQSNASGTYYFLVDTSESMSIASTTAEMKKLEPLTSNLDAKFGACAYTCHVTYNLVPKSFSDIAKENQIRTRLDVLRDAMAELVTYWQGAANGSSIGILAFQHELRELVYPPSTDAAAVLNAVTTSVRTVFPPPGVPGFASVKPDRRTPMVPPAHRYGRSHLNAALQELESRIPATSPDGVTVFILSDGVNNEYNKSWINRSKITPIDTTICDGLKNRGIRVAVLYTTYTRLDQTAYKQSILHTQNVIDDIKPAMEACASSPELFVEATEGGEIAPALINLFKAADSMPRLVN